MNDNLLEVREIAGGYGDLRVLWDVSLTVQAGKATVLLGRNGAGKSTLLFTIAGLLRPASGSICFRGQEITKSAPAHRTRMGIGFVQENKRVFKRRTVEQNLQLGGHTMPRKQVKPACEAAYDRFPILGKRRKQLAGALSGGQQQMLAIAQALMPGPALLMLDEPSAGLAPVIVQEVLEAVTALKASGLGILLVEQLVDQALSVADHVAVMEHGRVVSRSDGAAPDLETLRDIYLGRSAAGADAQ